MSQVKLALSKLENRLLEACNILRGKIDASEFKLTVRELASYLKIAEKTTYPFSSNGKVPVFKVGSICQL